MNVALNIYEAAMSKKRWKSPSKSKGKKGKPSWERENPEAAKLLRWAMSDDPVVEDNLVQMQLPERPK